MKRMVVSAFLVVGFCLCIVTEVGAQVKIGYVDSQKILTTFPAAIDARNALEEENTGWQKELQTMENNLRTLQERLDEQSLLLSNAKKQEKEEEIQALIQQIRRFQDEKWGQQGEYFKRQEDLMRPVFDRIEAAIRRVSDEEEYDFVFDTVQGNILHANDQYDLTDKGLTELEKEGAATTE